MSVAERASFLQGELHRQQQWFARRRRRDKRKAFMLQMATVALSAAITVLLGVRVGDQIQPVLSNIALGLGALVTVLAAMEAFFNHRGLWVSRTVTVRRLEALRRDLEYELVDGPASRETVDALLAKLNEIVADDQHAWLRLRSIDARSILPSQEPSKRPIGAPLIADQRDGETPYDG